MKNVIIIIETICIIGLLCVCVNLYNRLPGEVIENPESKSNVENFSEQVNHEDTNIELEEGTYVNSDDPELHYLTFKNGTVTSETYGKQVGTYRITGNKVFVVYTEAYDPDGNLSELETTEELYRIEGDALIQEQPYQMVYKLQ